MENFTRKMLLFLAMSLSLMLLIQPAVGRHAGRSPPQDCPGEQVWRNCPPGCPNMSCEEYFQDFQPRMNMICLLRRCFKPRCMCPGPTIVLEEGSCIRPRDCPNRG